MDMNTAQLFFSGSTEMNDWIPFQYEKDGKMVDFGEMVLTRTAGSAGNTYYVGIWRCGVCKMYFSSDAGDETFLVLEGELEIEVLATGEKFSYKPGDICSWTKGTPTMWDIKKPMKKMFVIADSKPA
ncbi:MAG: cupin domain-containing protein [Burkholderiales bacterium]|nr:cupin domain-containing protein [Burkholderiales bacterium]